MAENNNGTSQLIDSLDNWLRKNREDYYGNLQQGASKEQIESLEKSLGVTLPDELKLFLGWKNGQDSECLDSFIVNFGLMSTEDIDYDKKNLDELLEASEFERSNWWDRMWIPFIQNYSGDFWCIDLTGSFNGQPGQIISFWHDRDQRKILFPSFNQFLSTIVVFLEDIGFKSDDEKNTDQFWRIVTKLNPEYPKKFKAG